jgi:dolichol-phosphate mannosyltransferase
MAADLEDPPELIPLLLARWQSGHDVVWAIRGGSRGVNWRVRLISRLYWTLMRHIAVPETPAHGADAVLLDRRVLEALRQVGEKNTSLISLLMWMGFRQSQISYQKGERVGGHSGWTLSKRIKLAIDSVVSFSALPIRLTWLAGLLYLAAAAAWTAGVLVGWLLESFYVGRAVAVIVGLLLLGFGLGLTCLGAMGEYIWRIYDETRRRPRYLIERTLTGSASHFVAHTQEADLHPELSGAGGSPHAETGAELHA